MSSPTSGLIDFVYKGTTYQTWYTLTGNLHNLSPNVRPLIALHGGPGVPHDYMKPHTELLSSHGIPVILYDQIGCGQSTHINDAPKEFWTVDLFMDELESLLKHFGIQDEYDLLGHSWGGMLGANFAAGRHPKGLKHLIVADSPASMALWEEGTSKLVKELSQAMQDAIKKHEADGTTDAPEYQGAMDVFYKRHVCRLDPWPQELSKSLGEMSANPTVYQSMQGPSEFTVTGTLKTWTIVDILGTINVPTLLINSVYDEAQDVCVLPFFNKIPRVKWVQFSNSSHMPFFEESERYMKVLGDFLTLDS